MFSQTSSQGMTMSSLGEIEEIVRTQMQHYVSPRLGIFLSRPKGSEAVIFGKVASLSLAMQDFQALFF
jgi:hypothetical protein